MQEAGRVCPLCPAKFRLFRFGEGVTDFDSEMCASSTLASAVGLGCVKTNQRRALAHD